MSIEVVKSIKLTEYEADRVEKQSIVDSREIVSEAKKQAYKLLEDTIQEAEAKAKGILSLAEEKVKKEIEVLNNEVLEECSEIKKQAKKNIDNAVDIIMRRVVGAGVNS